MLLFVFTDLNVSYFSCNEHFLFCSVTALSILDNNDEVPTTTAAALSMNNAQPLSRRTRLLKGDG